jgi:hypothetical protein
MRIPLRLRHPIRWRNCVKASRYYSDDDWAIHYSPGQLYTIRYGTKR